MIKGQDDSLSEVKQYKKGADRMMKAKKSCWCLEIGASNKEASKGI
jgi:hypothetical protein